jgi:site-specific recombinase XerC
VTTSTGGGYAGSSSSFGAWGLWIHEALAVNEADLEPRRGSVLVRRGKGERRRQVGMDDWAWEQLQPWLKVRVEIALADSLEAESARRPAGTISSASDVTKSRDENS